MKLILTLDITGETPEQVAEIRAFIARRHADYIETGWSDASAVAETLASLILNYDDTTYLRMTATLREPPLTVPQQTVLEAMRDGATMRFSLLQRPGGTAVLVDERTERALIRRAYIEPASGDTDQWILTDAGREALT